MKNKPRLTIGGIPTRRIAIVLSALMDASDDYDDSILLDADDVRRLKEIAEWEAEIAGTGVKPTLTNLIDARLKQVIRNSQPTSNVRRIHVRNIERTYALEAGAANDA